ncbi:hypothetical protein AOLI_G00099460 [Acnodon oligacanthus]
MKATSPFALSHWTVEAGHMGMTSRYPDILSFIDPLGAEVTSVVYDLFSSCVILSPVQDPWSCCVLSALPKSQPYLEERFSGSITTNNGGPDTLRKVKMMYGPTKSVRKGATRTKEESKCEPGVGEKPGLFEAWRGRAGSRSQSQSN